MILKRNGDDRWHHLWNDDDDDNDNQSLWYQHILATLVY